MPCITAYLSALFKIANYLLRHTSDLIQKYKPVYELHIAP